MHAFLFQAVSFLVLPLWLLMICLPTWSVTRWLFRTPVLVVPFVLLYAILVVPFLGTVLPLLTNPNLQLNDVAHLLGQPEAALVAWLHFLAFDLFVGRWIYLDSRERQVNVFLMAPVLLLTLLLGPCG